MSIFFIMTNQLCLPTLHSERLELRELSDNDKPDLFKMRSNEKVLKYIERPKALNIEEIIVFIDRINNDVAINKVYYWAINLKNESKLIGTICLWNFSNNRKTAEIGYDLHPDYQGKGFMMEALNAVLKFAFKKLSIEIIEAFTHKHNATSINLLVKSGFQLIKEKKDDGFPNNIIFEIKKQHYGLR